MKGTIDFLKTSYGCNKKLFVVAILVIAAFLLVSCSTSGGGSAPSGPIGGGCGG